MQAHPIGGDAARGADLAQVPSRTRDTALRDASAGAEARSPSRGTAYRRGKINTRRAAAVALDAVHHLRSPVPGPVPQVLSGFPARPAALPSRLLGYSEWSPEVHGLQQATNRIYCPPKQPCTNQPRAPGGARAEPHRGVGSTTKMAQRQWRRMWGHTRWRRGSGLQPSPRGCGADGRWFPCWASPRLGHARLRLSRLQQVDTGGFHAQAAAAAAAAQQGWPAELAGPGPPGFVPAAPRTRRQPSRPTSARTAVTERMAVTEQRASGPSGAELRRRPVAE